MEVDMTRQKDAPVRCVYIALRWSAVTSARFSIDILLPLEQRDFLAPKGVVCFL